MSAAPASDAPFDASRACFEGLVGWLEGSEAAGLDHATLETRLAVDGRELLRRLLQDHLDLRASTECRQEVLDVDGVPHRNVEPGHQRALTTVFGPVTVERLAYRHRGHRNLHPADAVLNLPDHKHSHGLRRLAAIETARGSFDNAVDAVERHTGQRLGKRQLENLATRAAVDFDTFYASRPRSVADPDDILVISADGKGIVMRPDALRPMTAKAAGRYNQKLQGRLSRGEKRYRKRMAEVGTVYDLAPVPRSPTDILANANNGPTTPAPKAHNKWLTASVNHDASIVLGQVFDEADRRDPHRQRTWVAVVDGNNHQIRRINSEAQARHITVTIVIDFIHVLEYLWRAAWSFHDEGDPKAEAWVHDKARLILEGHPTRVAAAIRRKATYHRLDTHQRANADTCATYLTNKAPHLDYPTALQHGWPIATGVIEGACRHLVKDRMDLTGARWGLHGAEAVLKLRALHANGDFDHYWQHHLTHERQRVHQPRYANRPTTHAA